MISWFEKHNKISWIITIIGAILIFYISSLTFAAGPSKITLIPTFYHILAFFCFSFFLFISLVRGRKNYVIFIMGILIVIAYAISDEIHQFFVPGRYCNIFDVFLDLVGIFFAFMVYNILIIYRGNKTRMKR